MCSDGKVMIRQRHHVIFLFVCGGDAMAVIGLELMMLNATYYNISVIP